MSVLLPVKVCTIRSRMESLTVSLLWCEGECIHIPLMIRLKVLSGLPVLVLSLILSLKVPVSICSLGLCKAVVQDEGVIS